MRTLASIVTGRRSKWVVVGLWVLATIALSPIGGKLADETTDDTESFLPDSAESTEVVRILDDDFNEGETTQGRFKDYTSHNTEQLDVKAVEKLHPVHSAQILSYLKLSGLTVGLLINFNVVHLRDGIRRLVNNYRPESSADPLRP